MNISSETIDNHHHSIQVGNKYYAVNAKGYLIHFNDWDRDFSKRVAEIDRLELTPSHWEAIKFMRKFYSEYEAPPNPRIVIEIMALISLLSSNARG